MFTFSLASFFVFDLSLSHTFTLYLVAAWLDSFIVTLERLMKSLKLSHSLRGLFRGKEGGAFVTACVVERQFKKYEK